MDTGSVGKEAHGDSSKVCFRRSLLGDNLPYGEGDQFGFGTDMRIKSLGRVQYLSDGEVD